MSCSTGYPLLEAILDARLQKGTASDIRRDFQTVKFVVNESESARDYFTECIRRVWEHKDSFTERRLRIMLCVLARAARLMGHCNKRIDTIVDFLP